nr:glyceraldehyde-3-phosphate dehydrogenase, testis-specific-like [Lytechinus pictus]
MYTCSLIMSLSFTILQAQRCIQITPPTNHLRVEMEIGTKGPSPPPTDHPPPPADHPPPPTDHPPPPTDHPPPPTDHPPPPTDHPSDDLNRVNEVTECCFRAALSSQDHEGFLPLG